MKTKARYGHKKGLIALFVDLSSNCFITCGNDDDVRIWRGVDDEDVVDFRVGHTGAAVACHGNTFYVGAASGGFVKAYDKGTGTLHSGSITNFTLPITHMAMSAAGDRLIVSSSEIGVARCISLTDGRFLTMGYEHDAQVLSVALDPKEEFLATASGDGSVGIWQMTSGDMEHKIEKILMKTNDIRVDRPLARLCWKPRDGEFLAVPVLDGVQFYKRGTGWQLCKTLRHQKKTSSDADEKQLKDGGKHQPQIQGSWFSVCAYSWCGKYIAAGSVDGKICIWNTDKGDLLLRKQFSKKAHICALAWDPVQKDELIYCDVTGEIGALKDLCLDLLTADNPLLSPERRKSKMGIGSDDEDGDGDGGGSNRNKAKTVRRSVVMSDDDEELEKGESNWDLGALKKRYNAEIGLDEDGNTIETKDAQLDDDISEVRSNADSLILAQPINSEPSWRPTPPQPAFLVGSMPEGMKQRYMKWNSDGVVIHYNSENDNTIEVRFHDTSIHHQFTIDNTSAKFSLADLSTEAVALASRGQLQQDPVDISQLRVVLLKAWDNSEKEWTVDAPVPECIQCICLGNGWVAFGTNTGIIRVFTLFGVQHHIFSLPGPLVTMVGKGNRLAVVYHDAMGLDGEQCFSFSVYETHISNIRTNKTDISSVFNGRVALSRKSTLDWLGLLSNGAVCTADSNGIVRVINRSFHSTWLQIGDLNATIGKQENAWMVSVVENPPQIRCVMCKGGSKYPQVHPKPPMTVLEWTLPLCDTGSGKMELESSLIVNDVRKGFSSVFSDEKEVSKCEIETIVKLFALTCKSDRDCRSLEIAKLMPNSEAMRILIRIAVAQKRHVLAQKIGEVALQLAEEEQLEDTAGHGGDGNSSKNIIDLDVEHLMKVANGEDTKDKRPTDCRLIKLKKKRPQDYADINTGGGARGNTSTIPVGSIYGETSEISGDEKMETPAKPVAAVTGQRLNPFKKVKTDEKPKLPPGASIFDTLPSGYKKWT